MIGHKGGTVVFAAEAKWSNDPIHLDVLHTLQRRVALDAQIALFAKTGFNREVEAAQTPYLKPYKLDELL